ncbi:MAG: hypothetical protein QW782_06540 [Candidatus Bathyarchaeia archaeon]
MIYDELLRIWKEEITSDELVELPKSFISRIEEYLKKLAEENRMLDKKTAKASLLKVEEQNVKRMLKDIANLRYKKLIRKISKDERSRYIPLIENRNLIKLLLLTESYQSFNESLFSGKKSSKERQRKRITVRFLSETPEIMGLDMKSYGPYKPEDVASLPIENAEALIKQGLAVEIEGQ